MIRLLIDLLELGLVIFCFIECIQSPDSEVRNLPRWGWLIVIVILPLIGPIAWLYAGRPRHADRRRSVPWLGTPAPSSPRQAPRGPDDDAAFLSHLEADLNSEPDPTPDPPGTRPLDEDEEYPPATA